MMKYRQDLKDFNSGKTTVHPGAKPKIGFVARIGDTLNRKQEHVNEIDHGRHEYDSLKEKAGLKGVSDSNLSGMDKKKLETTFAKEKKSEIEADVRKGAAPLVDANGQTLMTKDQNGNKVPVVGESGFKAANRDALISQMKKNDQDSMDKNGDLTDEARKKIEDQLTVNFNAVLKSSTEKESTHKFEHLQTEAKQKVGGYDRLVTRSNKGSYDLRNLSQAKQDKREGMFTKGTTALIAGIAMGIRTGLKTSGINHGSGQADLLKDMSHTITEAMKSVFQIVGV